MSQNVVKLKKGDFVFISVPFPIGDKGKTTPRFAIVTEVINDKIKLSGISGHISGHQLTYLKFITHLKKPDIGVREAIGQNLRKIIDVLIEEYDEEKSMEIANELLDLDTD